ncbi:MAG: hypothetical protein E2O56_05880 [Gammaproteobacteria bacterium]|nr:MAG: hypothetical protein E2O56_05880 [Gammaproteobacteria bacterium]
MGWHAFLICPGLCLAGLASLPSPGEGLGLTAARRAGLADPGSEPGRAQAGRLGLFTQPMPGYHHAPDLALQGMYRAIEAQGKEGQRWAYIPDPRVAGTE